MKSDRRITMNDLNREVLQHNKLPDLVLDKLMEWIMSGKLSMGDKLNTEELASQLGVSRMPIREALSNLEKKGLAESIPYAGTRLITLTKEDVRQIYIARTALEPVAARYACEKITDEEIEEMKKAAEEFKMILKSKDITEIAEADVRFHDIIYMATDNQKLILLLNNLREQMYRYRVEYLKREEAYPQLIAEHAAIIEYISKGEKKAATDVMCKHIDNQVTTVIDVIRTKQN